VPLVRSCALFCRVFDQCTKNLLFQKLSALRSSELTPPYRTRARTVEWWLERDKEQGEALTALVLLVSNTTTRFTTPALTCASAWSTEYKSAQFDRKTLGRSMKGNGSGIGGGSESQGGVWGVQAGYICSCRRAFMQHACQSERPFHSPSTPCAGGEVRSTSRFIPGSL
jgi:hypothetical protein